MSKSMNEKIKTGTLVEIKHSLKDHLKTDCLLAIVIGPPTNVSYYECFNLYIIGSGAFLNLHQDNFKVLK